MAFDPFKYGNYYGPQREPLDGEAVSHFNYIRVLPTDLQQNINSNGSVGYYYSVPSVAFSKWMDYNFRAMQKEIQKYEPHWGNGVTKKGINYIYTAKVARADRVSYISCFMHEFFERGSVIVISADDMSTIWWKDYIKKMIERAFSYWASGLK